MSETIGKAVRVLHVEDDERDWLEPVQMFFPRRMPQGSTLVSVSTLHAMQEAIRDKHIDIAILDGNFPTQIGERAQWNADKAVEILGTKFHDIVILVLTANPPESANQNQRVYSYLDKVDGLGDLWNTINRIIQEQTSEGEMK
ncbi:MAG: hypothetical protein PHY14_03715 [Candidatus Gracilibacteria bacterium]|nr:hypothetical protein [Candidatus Gracilibacteria bacterium]